MVQNDKGRRAIQIAAQILYRYFPNIKIEVTYLSICDLIISFEDGAVCGISVKLSTYRQSKLFKKTSDYLGKLDFSNVEYRIPVLLLCVNESAETATFTPLIGWSHGRAEIYTNGVQKLLTEESSKQFSLYVHTMSDIISFLDVNHWNVLKKIRIETQTRDGNAIPAEIVYLRNFSNSYKMRNSHIVDEKISVDRLLNGIPQDDYPNDILDDCILKAIEPYFVNISVQSSLILLNSDVKQLQIYKSYCHTEVEIRIFPHLDDVYRELLVHNFDFPIYKLDLFTPSQKYKDLFENRYFETSLSFNTWVNEFASKRNTEYFTGNVKEYFV